MGHSSSSPSPAGGHAPAPAVEMTGVVALSAAGERTIGLSFAVGLLIVAAVVFIVWRFGPFHPRGLFHPGGVRVARTARRAGDGPDAEG